MENTQELFTKTDPNRSIVVQSPSIETILMAAVEKGSNVETLERLVALKERYDKQIAERSFNEAMSKFQSSCPVIGKKTEAKDATSGKVYFKYAALEDVIPLIQKPLAESELSYSFDGEFTEDNKVKIICTVKHILGHSRTATFMAPVDPGTQRMNSIQKVNSSVSYGRRISLFMALGLVAAGEDDDGNRGGNEKGDETTISDDQKMELEKLIGSNDEVLYTKTCQFYSIETLADLKESDFQQCKNRIIRYQQKKVIVK